MKLVKNDNDSIIWIKFEKHFFKTKNNRYVVAAYIPPENSPVHDLYNIDFFHKIETEISYYSQFGEVYLIGDLNSRTGRKCDYIDNDSVFGDLEDSSINPDTPSRRQSVDCISNRFGVCLLDLCKATEMRIVNGRVFHDTDKMTCYTPNGESVVDYLVTSEQNFVSLSKMMVYDYNEFSNHAPIFFAFKIGTERSREANTKYKCTYRWDENFKNEFVNSLKNDIHLLNNISEDNISIDCAVNQFSSFITERANPYFKKITRVNQESIFTCSNFTEKHKWYDQDCKVKKEKMQEAIRNFNLLKTDQNRKEVFERKKDYKYYCRKCKQKFNRGRCKQMDDMRKKKPREFWKLFRGKNSNTQNNLSENDFFEYFKKLSSEISENTPDDVSDFMQNFDSSQRETTFSELDEPISQAEIRSAIQGLKTNKSCGIDDIINEYFKNAAEILIEPLHMLFNRILNSRIFPTQWTTGLIVPIHKKGDFDDTNNYRGITLISCFAKLFTSILNKRLKKWADETDISTDAQFGFKANYSTIDAAFILKYLIDKQLQAKKKLYCAFVDLKKAFDSVSRLSLWYKLLKCGLDGKIFDIIRSMYKDIKLKVKCLNNLSDFYSCDVGLLQGEIMSPFLFSLFINDIELNLQENIYEGISIEQLQLYLLLFADDAVLFSETREGLQKNIDNLENYCRKWNLTVNVEKTKIVVFRKGGVLGQNDHWFYAGQELEIVNNFTYLGIVFSSGGSFMQNTKTLCGKALKAMHQLLQLIKEIETPIAITLKLFDSLVASVLHYGCEVWGFLNAECIERVHRKFCKYILNVKPSTNNYALYNELGRYPLIIERHIRIIKYWFKLLQKSETNCILQSVYNCMKIQIDTGVQNMYWLAKVKLLLERNGFAEVWCYPQSVNVELFIPVFKTRLIDNFLVELRGGLNTCTSMVLYRELKQCFEISPYLQKLCNRKLRNSLSKLRLSSHQLLIEKGRHSGIVRQNRICVLCNKGEIEDEYHFVLICPQYHQLRMQYIRKYYVNHPSMYKFIQLLNSTGKTLKNLAIFITNAFQARNESLNDIVLS